MEPPTFLDMEDVLEFHRDQIERYGGSLGIRDLKLLESALAMPQAGMGGRYFHEDLFEMAAAYLFHIVRNHPFLDGNKRVGTVAALVFLELNGVRLRISNDDLVEMVLSVATGETEKSGIVEFFRKRSRS